MKLSGKSILSGLIILGIGIGIGFFLHTHTAPVFPRGIRQPDSGYQFISPLLYVTAPAETSLPEYTSFKKDIGDIVNKQLASGKMVQMSVYFRDLSTNDWFGINENDTYSPASLLKVATLMTFLRMAEINPGLLDSKIAISKTSENLNETSYQYFKPTNPVKTGQTYTTQDLLSRMIIESDNNASGAFQSFIGISNLMKTYRDLNLVTATSTPETISITPATYSRIFRVLYNGTYLSHNLSEQTLSLLSRTTFTGGLMAGVPKGTIVSHKFGEWTYAAPVQSGKTAENIHELHDCGIIYYPDHPYFLCVMTEGSADFPALEGAIKEVSATVWAAMDRLYKK